MGTYPQLEETLYHRLKWQRNFKNNLILEEVAKRILKRLGETQDPQFIGYGQYADVLWLKGNRKKVLKLTTDPNDAWAAQILKDKPSKDLLQVSDVFRPLPKEKVFYGIVAEKLSDPSGTELYAYDALFHTLRDKKLPLRKLLKKGLTPKLVDALEDYLKMRDDHVQENPPDLSGWGELAKRYKFEARLEKYAVELKVLREWAEALSKRHIVFTDLHIGNVRFRGRKAILVDLGHGKVPNKQSKIPELF